MNHFFLPILQINRRSDILGNYGNIFFYTIYIKQLLFVYIIVPRGLSVVEGP